MTENVKHTPIDYASKRDLQLWAILTRMVCLIAFAVAASDAIDIGFCGIQILLRQFDWNAFNLIFIALRATKVCCAIYLFVAGFRACQSGKLWGVVIAGWMLAVSTFIAEAFSAIWQLWSVIRSAAITADTISSYIEWLVIAFAEAGVPACAALFMMRVQRQVVSE